MTPASAIILIMVAVCVPIYCLIGLRRFAAYLVILLCGSLLQYAGTGWIYGFNRPLAMLFYETLGLVIDISLLIFVITTYLRIRIIMERRFILFLVTTSLGIGLRWLKYMGSMADILDLGLVFNLMIAVIGLAWFNHRRFRIRGMRDRLLAPIIFSSVMYLVGYTVIRGAFFTGPWWNLVMIITAGVWLWIGFRQIWRQYG